MPTVTLPASTPGLPGPLEVAVPELAPNDPVITVVALSEAETEGGETFPVTDLLIAGHPCSWAPRFSDGPFFRRHGADGRADFADWLHQDRPDWSDVQVEQLADHLADVLDALHKAGQELTASLLDSPTQVAREIAALALRAALSGSPEHAGRLEQLTNPEPLAEVLRDLIEQAETIRGLTGDQLSIDTAAASAALSRLQQPRPTANVAGPDELGCVRCESTDLSLTEDGYTCSWSVMLLRATLVASYEGGSKCWSPEGDGDEYLTCRGCLTRMSLPAGLNLIYR